MKIKRFSQFEAISGWELVGQHIMGPNYPEQKLAVTLNTSDTEMVLGIDDNIYTYDDYQDLYNRYLKVGGQPLQGFNKQNLDLVLSKLTKLGDQY